MYGLSPTQPLFPPEYCIFGFNFKILQIISIDCFTVRHSFVPKLIMFTFLLNFLTPKSIALIQSST